MTEGRAKKVLTSLILIAFSYFIFLERSLPYRATVDERTKFGDIREIVLSGGIENVTYWSGLAHQVVTAILIRIGGLTMQDTQWLSPVIGVITLACIMACIYKIYRHQINQPWWGFIAPILALFVFGTLLNGIRETSHKKYTYLLLFLLLAFILPRHRLTRGDIRDPSLLLVLGGAITLQNYIWGAVYGTAVVVAKAAQGDSSVKHTAMAWFSLLIFSYMIPSYMPNLHLHRSYIVSAIISVIQFFGISAEVASQGGATGTFALWPSYHFFGISINAWFIWSFGVLLSVLISTVVTLYAGSQILRGRTVSRFGKQVLAFNLFFGGLALLPLIKFDIATVRRLTVIPAILGVAYFATLQLDSFIFHDYDLKHALLLGVCCLLLLSSVLAVNRVAVNGDESLADSPLDSYASENEVASINYISQYGSKGAVTGDSPMDRWVSAKRLGWMLVPQSDESHQPIIYDSGDRGKVYYLG